MMALAIAGIVGSASCAEAATYFYSDTEPGIYRPEPAPPQMPRKHRRKAKNGPGIDKSIREATKPQGPLIIAISINEQRLKLYDANGVFAETPVSTGMKGHSTPMGVFSVIQKDKFHKSNIYSNAPMPYMQRITWSGVAIHAGVLPGYPASHGCIRMPMAFAMKMWVWTRMGARVIITPGEVTPAQFTHPLLEAQKPAPVPVAATQPAVTPKSDKVTISDAPKGSEISAANMQAKPQGDAARAGANEPAPTRTADASNSSATSGASLTASDATTAMNNAAVPTEKPVASNAVATDEPKAGATVTAEIKAEVSKADTASAKVESTKPSEKAAAGPVEDRNKAAVVASPSLVDASKDQTRPPDAEKAPVAKPDSTKPDLIKPDLSKSEPAIVANPKRGSQIAVLISRKDSKLYVRQNLAPLFEVPVTIAPSDRPMGTHVFTAAVDKSDAGKFNWSVVTMPMSRRAERIDVDERETRRRKSAGAIEVKSVPVPDSPTEALDRVTIPDEARAKINDALTTGGSIIVSDQGVNSGETGEGTDFIVLLR